MPCDTRYQQIVLRASCRVLRRGTRNAERRTSQSTNARGFLLTELIVALSVLGLLLAGLAMSLHGFAKFNRYQLVRQQCIAAAQAQLDSIAVTGRSIPDEDFSRLWPGLTVAIKQTPGEGQWQGHLRCEVTASGKTFRQETSVQLSRYIVEGK